MSIIIIITIAIYAILALCTWQNMPSVNKSKRMLFIVIGIFVVFLITLIIFNISKSGINYQNVESKKAVRNILVSVFTGVNGIIIMPYIAKQINRISENDITQEEFSKKIVVILIIFLICIIFECGYLKKTQEGILNIYNSSSQKGI